MALLAVADLSRVLVHTVEVHSCQRSAIVANNDTVWIQHWHEFKDKMVAETLWGKEWRKRGGEKEKGATEDFRSYRRLQQYCSTSIHVMIYCGILWYTDFGVSGVGGEALHHALHHPTAVGLPRVHS